MMPLWLLHGPKLLILACLLVLALLDWKRESVLRQINAAKDRVIEAQRRELELHRGRHAREEFR